jgi:membrane protease YdiL (CAAX protease family)
VIVSALFFALIHGNLVQGPMTFFLGLALGMITVRTQSLRPAIYIHVILNTSSVLKGYLLQPLEQDFSTILNIASQVGIVLLAFVLVIINWGKVKTFLNVMARRPDQSLQQTDMTEANESEAINTVPVDISTVSADTHAGECVFVHPTDSAEANVVPHRPPRRWFYFWTSWSTLIALILFTLNMLLSIKAISM